MDDSLSGASIQVILQARILKWVTIPFPRDLPNSGIKPGSSTWQAEFSPSEPPGKLNVQLGTNKIFHFLDYFFHWHNFMSPDDTLLGQGFLKKRKKVKSLSHVWLFVTTWTIAYQVPLSWDFPGKSTGVGCHFLFQGIFQTQGLNLGLLHHRQSLYCLIHQGSPRFANLGAVDI